MLISVTASVSALPVFIAQNDPVQFAVEHPAGTCWYFPTSERIEQQKLYDIPAVKYGEKYVCELGSAQTANMREGDYVLIYTYPSQIGKDQFPPKYLKDISWNNSKLTSLFVAPRDEHGMQAARVMQDLKEMTSASKLDGMEEYQISVQPPMITITRQEGVGWNLIRISGESNMADGTTVRIEIDELDRVPDPTIDKYYNFTFYTKVNRQYISEKGNWSCDMLLPIQSMTPGWHHTSVYAAGLETTARFPIYQAWTPEPTPTQYINYFGNGSMKPDVVTVTIPVPGPTRVVELWHTATPTPPITDALGNKIVYPPYKASEVIPGWVMALALVACVGVVVMRDRK